MATLQRDRLTISQQILLAELLRSLYGAAMAKKKCWFNLVKSFFISDKHSIQDKKNKRRKWQLFGRFRTRSRLPSIAAPVSPPRDGTTLSDAAKQQSKHALNVALATAAAAEAAVAAAHAAAEVVRLTGVPQSTHHSDNEREEPSEMKIKPDAPHSIDKCERYMQEFAAIIIQTAFRGYLARKALRALKGIVMLQAIIRGRNVRRQALTTLKCLESMVTIQSQARASRMQLLEGTCQFDEDKQLYNVRDKIVKMDMNSQRQWDGSILTKEDADAVFLSKKEAAMKRERIKEYSFNHRNSTETERSKLSEKWRIRLDQWVDAQAAKSKELEDLDSVLASNPKHRLEYRGKQLKLRGLQRQYQLEAPEYSLIAAPRRSYHRKQCSLGEENAFSGSPVVPTYMASTESAKAKVRSLSSPKLRPGSLFDAYSESYSPCKNKISLASSTATEVPMNGKFGRSIAHQQRSPSLKGIAGPIRSSQTSKDVSFDSQCSFRTWGQRSSFR